MTPIESIWEIRNAVLDLQKYLTSKDDVVRKRAHSRYLEWMERFFRENRHLLTKDQRRACVDDVDYFLSMLDEIEAFYND